MTHGEVLTSILTDTTLVSVAFIILALTLRDRAILMFSILCSIVVGSTALASFLTTGEPMYMFHMLLALLSIASQLLIIDYEYFDKSKRVKKRNKRRPIEYFYKLMAEHDKKINKS